MKRLMKDNLCMAKRLVIQSGTLMISLPLTIIDLKVRYV